MVSVKDQNQGTSAANSTMSHSEKMNVDNSWAKPRMVSLDLGSAESMLFTTALDSDGGPKPGAS